MQRIRVPRPIALLIGVAAAVVLFVLLVAPVVLRGGGSGTECAQELAFRGRAYSARPLSGTVQRLAIGVGVVSGCGQAASNVDIRSIAGVAPARAVAVPADATSAYVRLGLCQGVPPARLLACLRR